MIFSVVEQKQTNVLRSNLKRFGYPVAQKLKESRNFVLIVLNSSPGVVVLLAFEKPGVEYTAECFVIKQVIEV